MPICRTKSIISSVYVLFIVDIMEIITVINQTVKKNVISNHLVLADVQRVVKY